MSNRNLFRADFLFAAENEGKIIERRRVRINNALSQQYLVFSRSQRKELPTAQLDNLSICDVDITN